ncbi:MAG: HipA domain-containing protein [Acidimicrobiaceae bacterium]|nr:HipA domain-containing protein [Acidimicrobiaceae bacterium]
MTSELLTVRMHGVPAGRILRNRQGRLSFAYDPQYMSEPQSVPLSIALPFGADEYGDNEISTWIASLLPDNQRVLDNWYRLEQIADRSPFGVLSTPIGFDCAGAVQFCTSENEHDLDRRKSGTRLLSARELSVEVSRIVADPTMWTAEGVEPYFSLGGMQSKIALHRDGRRWARPVGDTPTTHILKPRAGTAGEGNLDEQAAMEGSRLAAIGEHLCLAAARRLGIDAAESWIEQHGRNVATVVARFDRRHDGSEWKRLHQEDMCQALGLPSVKKYEKDGGPSASRIGDLIRTCSTDPDGDLLKFADALLYAWLTINRDAHAKNYGLLHLAGGETRLAPVYDLHSSLFFAGNRLGHIEFAARYGDDFTVFKSNSREMLPTMAARLVLPLNTLTSRAEHLVANICSAFSAEIERLPAWAYGMGRLAEFMERLEIRSAACAKTVSSTQRKRKASRHET